MEKEMERNQLRDGPFCICDFNILLIYDAVAKL